jgi:hypothetical protein
MKRWFMARLLRERILLGVFALLGVGIWGSSVLNRAGAVGAALRRTGVDLEEQARWLSQRETVERESAQAAGRLEPGRTFNAVRLQAELDALAGQAGLNARELGDPKTERTGAFSVHSVQLNARNADYAALVRFYSQVKARAPYMGIEELSLVANRSNPAQLNAVLRISAVEIPH